MIKKYLIVGKQIYLSSKRPEPHEEPGTICEIEMPVETYWKVVDLFKQYNYLQASRDSQAEVVLTIKNIFALLKKYAVDERDRFWLQEKSVD